MMWMRVCAVATLGLAAGVAAARPDGHHEVCHHQQAAEPRSVPAFDPVTGRDLSTYPPSPVVDFIHMRLEIDIPDMNTPRLTAVQTLTLRAYQRVVPEITLDARLMEIERAEVPGRGVVTEYDGERLRIAFDPPLAPWETIQLVLAYAVKDPPAGLIWTPESPAWPGRPAQIHTQGQAETNSYWFPCHDFPNERLTTELIVTVPEGYLVSSNGREVGRPQTIRGPGGNRTRFHWLQDKSHVNYLVSMVVGKFDVVDVSGGGPVPMPVYVPPGQGPLVQGTYGRTRQMVDLFGRLTGEPYPWDRYAQLVVWNFGAGGMENTSATTLYDTAVLTPEGLRDGDMDGLISHELAHQWFGDLITCRSWAHTWLNEGFATYFTALWNEHRHGAAAYQASIRGAFDSVIGRDRADAPYAKAMVTNAYTDPWQQFGGAANPYPKGASILHMLRVRLGDEVFFRGVAEYVDRFKGRTVETDDLRRTLEEVSGESLVRFFRQWCQRPGVPEVEVGVEYDEVTRELVVNVRQTQNIDGYNPAFEFDLPIWAGERRAERLGVVHVDGRDATARFAMPRSPAMVVVDPELAVLANLTVNQPAERWLVQLERGPTWAARVQAARALGESEDARAGDALLRIARNGREPESLRGEAARAIQKRGDAEALMQLSRVRDLPADVAVALCEAAAAVGSAAEADPGVRARMIDLLVERTTPPHTERTRAEAVRGLGRLKAVEHAALVLAAADVASQHDRIRQAALEALADLDVAEGLAVAARYAAPGTLNRTRPVAIQALARLAHHDRETAYSALSGLLMDREWRAWRAVGTALVELGDARGLEALAALEQAKRDERDRAQVREWIAALREKIGG